MWAMGIVFVLLCWNVWLLWKGRKAQRIFRQEQEDMQGKLNQAQLDTEAEQALCAQLEHQIQDLQETLAEKEQQIATLTAPPAPKLCIPDPETLPAEDTECIVYFNEHTGIYHADRACAPYQAIPLPLAEVKDNARPCKKCAEGRLPAPTQEQTPPEPGESQLSLFDLT